MKTKTITSLRLLCLKTFALVVWMGGMPITSAALNNGDFEMGSTAGWQVYNPDGQPFNWGVTSDPAKVRSGSYAGALTAFGGTNSVLIIHNSTNVLAQPAGSVWLGRMYVKTENLELATPTGYVWNIVVVRDAMHNVIGYHTGNAALRGTHTYTAVDTLFTLPPGAVQVELQILLDASIVSGAVYVDDADVRLLEEEGPLLNSGFEIGSTAGWQVFNPDGQPLSWGVTSEPANVHSGSYAGALTAFGGTNSALILHNGVDVSAWPQDSLCLAKVRIKTVDLQLADPKKTLRIELAFRNAAGEVIGHYAGNGDFLGSWDYTPIELLSSVPHRAVRADVSVTIFSGIVSGAAYVDDVELERIAELGEVSTNTPLAEVKRDTKGTPRLYIDGIPKAPTFFYGVAGHPVIYDEMKRAAAAGVELITINMDLPWRGTSTGVLEQSLEAHPDAFFLLHVALYPPAWWVSQHPGLAFVDENGAPPANDYGGPSLASDEFITACKDQLGKLIRYLHNTPYRSRIIAYHFTYLTTQEWFYPEMAQHFWDYSEVNRLRFIQWLETRYADVAALNTAWHKSYATFADVQIPSPAEWQTGNDGVFRDPAQQRAVPDYAEYHNHLVADRIAELAAHIKGLTADRSLTAAYYGYISHLIINGGNRGMAHSGHLGLKRLLASTDIDIVCSPVAYFGREVGGPADMMSVVDAVTLAGKLYLQEEDSNTYLITPAPPNDWIPWYPTEWDTMQCLRRNYGDVVGHNQGMWWIDLGADGRYDGDSIWTNNALLLSTAKDVVAKESAFEPQVAVLFDEETYFWLKADSDHLNSPNVLELRSLFQSLGAAAGYYLVEDLAAIPASAKLIVFANTHRLDAAERAMIQAGKTNGRTFLWLYAPGYVSETDLSVDNMTDVTGFTFVRSASSINPSIRMVSGAVSPISAGLANHTFGSQSAITPTFYVSPGDGDIDVLGRYTANNQPALLAKDYGDWKSVFCGAPKPSLQVLRSIARYAGVNLLADADTLNSVNAVNSIDPYLYVYAMNNAGRRTFQLPGEKVPNGNFEKFTGALPSSGFGRWVSPHAGSLAICSVVNSNAAAGNNACATGPFHSSAGQNSEPLGIELHGEIGRTYHVSCSVYVDGLDAASAVPSDAIALVIQARDGASNFWTGIIASGNQTPIPEKAWTRLEGSFTFTGGDPGPYQNAFEFLLQVNGPYSVNNLLIDNVSVREDGCEPVDVTEIVSNTSLGHKVTNWADDFALNEQKIFRLTPSAAAFNITELQFLGTDLLRLQWQSLSGSHRYTVEETDGLPPEWLPAAGTNAWPVSTTEAVLPINGDKKLFRVKGQP